MCYSAQLHQHYRRFLRESGTKIDFDAFVKLYGHRPQGSALRRSRVMDALFSDPQTDAERQVQALIAADDRRQIEQWRQELFRQRKRLVDAERQLQVKATKKTESDARIAGDKVRRLTAKLRPIQSSELSGADCRIYPMWYAPVIVWEDGQRVVSKHRWKAVNEEFCHVAPFAGAWIETRACSSMHAIATTPAEPLGARFALFPKRWQPSPFVRRVGFRIDIFEACSAFTHVTACMFAKSLFRTLCIEGFSRFVASTTASTATGWSLPKPVRGHYAQNAWLRIAAP